FYVLYGQGAKTITEIAGEIGHSQPSVTKMIKEMAKAGWVRDNLNSKDKRRNVVELTARGKRAAGTITQVQSADIQSAMDGIMAEAGHNLWAAIGEWETLLEQKSLYERVRQQKKLREGRDVRIVEYRGEYQEGFRALNREWISTFFEMEESDHLALDNPEEHILKKGGMIFVALYGQEPVGVCALIKMDDARYGFELAKMAVSPKVQGRNIGWLLGQAVIQAAKKAGATRIYLETNTLLGPAINLYHKLGFKRIMGHPSPYRRCNLQMELDLDPGN